MIWRKHRTRCITTNCVLLADTIPWMRVNIIGSSGYDVPSEPLLVVPAWVYSIECNVLPAFEPICFPILWIRSMICRVDFASLPAGCCCVKFRCFYRWEALLFSLFHLRQHLELFDLFQANPKNVIFANTGLKTQFNHNPFFNWIGYNAPPI